mmetsp:Transcript_15968/g.49880  ORF Transcript_15968/g.49880 Transcript_15968/m.49880 type:complete len:172 (-) Transcript_15968:101-616(-)
MGSTAFDLPSPPTNHGAPPGHYPAASYGNTAGYAVPPNVQSYPGSGMYAPAMGKEQWQATQQQQQQPNVYAPASSGGMAAASSSTYAPAMSGRMAPDNNPSTYSPAQVAGGTYTPAQVAGGTYSPLSLQPQSYGNLTITPGYQGQRRRSSRGSSKRGSLHVRKSQSSLQRW